MILRVEIYGTDADIQVLYIQREFSTLAWSPQIDLKFKLQAHDYLFIATT